MGMFRRSRKSTPPLRRKQQDIARQEAELREKLEKLERVVTRRGASARGKSRAQTAPSGKGKPEKRLQVSVALDGRQLFDPSLRSNRKPRALRKQRREGQIIFLFLLTALAFAVIWLISHLHL